MGWDKNNMSVTDRGQEGAQGRCGGGGDACRIEG